MDEALIARIFQLFLALAGAYLLALWFALVVWTYRDITSRSTNAFTQIFSTLVVVLFFVPGAIIYLILRPRETLDEAFQRSMEEEYLLQDLDDIPLCPICRRAIRDDFVFCPHCSAELRHACNTCHRLVDVRWEVCPYCGSDQSLDREPEPRELIRETAGSRSRQRAATAPLQAIDGGRAGQRPDSGNRRPRQLREDEALAEPAGDSLVEAHDDAESTDEHPATTPNGVPVRNRGGRARATGRRRGESGN
ncbi:MAG TPA: zinc ribbon domain-containing protein [Thermomicrobiales bacterium]|nr:zinc ribbon domain-containing protein [Thermomicrobiales bacterium]